MNSAVKLPSQFLGNYLGITVFLVAVVVRGLVGWVMLDNLDADPDAYAAIARSIERNGVYGLVDDQGIARPTAFRPPLYPWVLSLMSISAQEQRGSVLVLHALLGGWTVVATFLICRRYASIPPSILAAMLVTLDPILLMQSTLVMTETLATALSASVLWWCAVIDGFQKDATRRQKHSWMKLAAVVLGVLLMLSYLCRPTFLVWAVLMALAWAKASFWRDRLANWRSNLLFPAIVILIVAAGVGAWTIRNWNAIGHPIWATTHGGYTLLLGNNPMFYRHLQTSKLGEVWDAGPFLEAYQNRERDDENTGEYSDDRRAYEAAKATIESQPKMFVYSCFVRLARLWSPMPHQVQGRSETLNSAVALFYAAVFLSALLGLFKLRRRRLDRFLIASLTLATTLSLVHSVYWSNMRMRAPLTPAIAILAAAGCFRRSDSPKLSS